MPWSLKQRDGKWCVIKDSDGSEAGCHSSRTDAIKQQRALYAQESRVAAMYAELDAEDQETVESYVEEVVESKPSSELVKIEIGKEQTALTAALLDRMDAMSQREALTTEAIVAALHAIGTRENVVNVAAPPAPNVTVEAPPAAEVKVDVHVPEQETPEVNLTVNPIVQPAEKEKRTVTFVRDYTGRIEGAEIAEE